MQPWLELKHWKNSNLYYLEVLSQPSPQALVLGRAFLCRETFLQLAQGARYHEETAHHLHFRGPQPLPSHLMLTDTKPPLSQAPRRAA